MSATRDYGAFEPIGNQTVRAGSDPNARWVSMYSYSTNTWGRVLMTTRAVARGTELVAEAGDRTLALLGTKAGLVHAWDQMPAPEAVAALLGPCTLSPGTACVMAMRDGSAVGYVIERALAPESTHMVVGRTRGRAMCVCDVAPSAEAALAMLRARAPAAEEHAGAWRDGATTYRVVPVPVAGPVEIK